MSDSAMTPDADQAAAIDLACRERVVVLTGGPGVGKSQALLWILAAWRTAGARTIQLCAPTGKAAKRVTEMTGERASTIHRLLAAHGHRLPGGPPLPPGTEAKDVTVDALVMDEASMTDSHLAASLLTAMSDGARVLIVGDVDQLPSIGCGQVLRDLIDSGAIPVARLTVLHRQSARSYIHLNARAIREGEMPCLDNDQMDDFRFLEHESTDAAFIAACDEAVRLHGIYGEVGVLTPKRRVGELRSGRFNVELQRRLNPAGPGKVEIQHVKDGDLETVLREGDRVRHTRNDYDLACEDGSKGVFNGEVGKILTIKPAWRVGVRQLGPIVRVDYGDRIAVYDGEQARELVLAYAGSIHSCVAPDTLVETPEGLRPIASLSRAGGRVATNGRHQRYSRFHDYPEAGPMLRLVTGDGYALAVTGDHGVDVWSRGRGQYVRKNARDIAVGDGVRLRLGAAFDPACIVPCPPAPPVTDRRAHVHLVPSHVTPELAELLGLIVADGTVFRGGFRLVKSHADVVGRFAVLCRLLLGANVKQFMAKRRTPAAEVDSVMLASWILSFGGTAPRAKAVPDHILRSPLRVQAAFLRGLFEDGTVNIKAGKLDHIEWGNKSASVVGVVQTMLLRFGIISSRRARKGGRYTALYIYGEHAKAFGHAIGFVAEFKTSRLGAPVGSETRYTVPMGRGMLRAVARHAAGTSAYRNALNRGYMSRAGLRGVVALLPKGKIRRDLSARLGFHHTRIGRVESAHGPSMCLTVPGHRFLQNGFVGWNSQGSEYPAVVTIAHSTDAFMLSRSLFYTAVTRGKLHVTVVGDREGVARAVGNDASTRRVTTLADRLRAASGAGVA